MSRFTHDRLYHKDFVISQDAKIIPGFFELLWEFYPRKVLVTDDNGPVAAIVHPDNARRNGWRIPFTKIHISHEFYRPYMCVGEGTLKPLVQMATEHNAILSLDLDLRLGQLLLVPCTAGSDLAAFLDKPIQLTGIELPQIKEQIFLMERRSVESRLKRAVSFQEYCDDIHLTMNTPYYNWSRNDEKRI